MEKTVLALAFSLIGLASVPSFASSCTAANGLYAEYPKIAFGSTFVSIDGLCVKGDRLFTKSEVSVCSEWNGNDVDPCSRYEKKILSTSRQYTKEIPNGETGFITVSGTYPLNYSVPVGTPGEAFNVTCEMAYTIPACQ